MRTLAAILSLLLLALPLAGCWSATDVERKGYIQALGVDYQDNQFIVYAQLLDFSNIAKSEAGGKQGNDPVTYIGRGKGTTLNNATDNLYQTAQVSIVWGHLSALIMSEKALKKEGFRIIEMLNRYPEIRYNTWLFSTKEPFDELLKTNSLFKLPSLYTILHDPLPNYKQFSMLPPVKMFEYIADYNEPAITSYVPSIGINKEQWQETKKQIPLLKITGAHFKAPDGENPFFTRTKLEGYQWMQKKMNRAPLTIEKNGVRYANLSLGRPKIKIKPIVEGMNVSYQISVQLIGAMYEYNEPLPYEEMIQIAQDTIKKQIMDVYEEGVQNNVDIFNLGQSLRLKNVNAWKQISDNGKKLIVHKHSIQDLKVKVVVPYNGKYKRIPATTD